MTKSLTEYDSLWEWTKQQSTYHFNNKQEDRPGEAFKVIGRFDNTWAEYIDQIKADSNPTNWETITYAGGGNQYPIGYDKRAADLAKGGGDIKKIEVTDITDDFTKYPKLQKIIDYFCLDRTQARIHVQYTGQMFTMHLDPIHRLFAGPDAKPGDKFDYDPKDIVRITVMLEDWQPGQFYQYGNSVYQKWAAGDIHMHDWVNIPHATANASEHSRCTLQITGLRTARTNAIIGTYNFLPHTL